METKFVLDGATVPLIPSSAKGNIFEALACNLAAYLRRNDPGGGGGRGLSMVGLSSAGVPKLVKTLKAAISETPQRCPA